MRFIRPTWRANYLALTLYIWLLDSCEKMEKGEFTFVCIQPQTEYFPSKLQMRQTWKRMEFFAIVDTINKILEVNKHPKKATLTIDIHEIKTM